MKATLTIAGISLLIAFGGFVGYFVGYTRASMKWSWVPKEHNLLLGSMERIEILLGHGDTGTVLRAVGAYNQNVRGMTNEFDFYRAAGALWGQAKEKP